MRFDPAYGEQSIMSNISRLSETVPKQERLSTTVLRKMNEEEFRAFKAYSIADYAQDLMKGKDLTQAQALKYAEEEFDEGLPDGLETKDRFLMNIEDRSGKTVGWIWFEYYTDEADGTRLVFLADLLVFEEERRKGYASAALCEMNALAKRDGCARSELFVWDHNPGGQHLYEKCGYQPARREKGGMLMAKAL